MEIIYNREKIRQKKKRKMNDKDQNLCKLYKCQKSVVIEHLNGNTLDNRIANLKVIGYLPPGNHRVFGDCRAGQWNAPHIK